LFAPTDEIADSCESHYLPVVKQAAELPQSDFHPVAKPATDHEPLQTVLQKELIPPVAKLAAERVDVASPPTVTMQGVIIKTRGFKDFAA